MKILLGTLALIAGTFIGSFGSEVLNVGGGLGTINQLDQFTSTSTPFDAITTNSHGKDLYIPFSNATTSQIAVTGLVSCDTIDTDADGNFSCGTDDGGGGGGTGTVSTSTSETAGQLPYWTSTGATPATLGSIATTTPTIGSGLSYSGTFGNIIGGASGTLSLDATGDWTGTLDGIEGANFLRSDIADTAAGLITFDAGITSTGALNLFGNASSTLLSVFDIAYFGGTATSTFDSAGNLSLIGNLVISGDTINDFAGTGLTVSGNALTADLGTSVTLTSEVDGILPVANGGTASSTPSRFLFGDGAGNLTSTSTISNIWLDSLVILSTEIDTYSELNALVGDVTLTHNGLFDTESELEALVTDMANIIQEAEIDTLAELNAILSDATLVDLDDTQTLTNKTIDGDDNDVLIRTHATDCTSITDGKHGEFCYETDDNVAFVCDPAAGDCDTAGEWLPIGQILGSGSDGDSSTVNSDSGLETIGGFISLLRGCADGQPLEWDEGNDYWECGTDNDTGSGLNPGKRQIVTIDGTDSDTCGTLSAPCATIEQAIANIDDAATFDYIIDVKEGSYVEAGPIRFGRQCSGGSNDGTQCKGTCSDTGTSCFTDRDCASGDTCGNGDFDSVCTGGGTCNTRSGITIQGQSLESTVVRVSSGNAGELAVNVSSTTAWTIQDIQFVTWDNDIDGLIGSHGGSKGGTIRTAGLTKVGESEEWDKANLLRFSGEDNVTNIVWDSILFSLNSDDDACAVYYESSEGNSADGLSVSGEACMAGSCSGDGGACSADTDCNASEVCGADSFCHTVCQTDATCTAGTGGTCSDQDCNAGDFVYGLNRTQTAGWGFCFSNRPDQTTFSGGSDSGGSFNINLIGGRLTQIGDDNNDSACVDTGTAAPAFMDALAGDPENGSCTVDADCTNGAFTTCDTTADDTSYGIRTFCRGENSDCSIVVDVLGVKLQDNDQGLDGVVGPEISLSVEDGARVNLTDTYYDASRESIEAGSIVRQQFDAERVTSLIFEDKSQISDFFAVDNGQLWFATGTIDYFKAYADNSTSTIPFLETANTWTGIQTLDGTNALQFNSAATTIRRDILNNLVFRTNTTDRFSITADGVLDIPAGTGLTIDAEGEFAIDTTDNQLTYYSGSQVNVLNPVHTRCGAVEDLQATDDNLTLGSWGDAVTIQNVWCSYNGTGSTVAQISLEDGAGNAMTHTTPTCTANGTPPTAISVTSGGGLTATEILRFDVDNTPDPTSDDYTICVDYTFDRQ